MENKGLVERIQSKDNKKHIEIVMPDKAELIVEAGINLMCVNVFDKICNNAEEHLREYKDKDGCGDYDFFWLLSAGNFIQ